jgi:hypothetical protein
MLAENFPFTNMTRRESTSSAETQAMKTALEDVANAGDGPPQG